MRLYVAAAPFDSGTLIKFGITHYTGQQRASEQSGPTQNPFGEQLGLRLITEINFPRRGQARAVEWALRTAPSHRTRYRGFTRIRQEWLISSRADAVHSFFDFAIVHLNSVKHPRFPGAFRKAVGHFNELRQSRHAVADV